MTKLRMDISSTEQMAIYAAFEHRNHIQNITLEYCHSVNLQKVSSVLQMFLQL